jgi:type VI secretion system protein ImpA
MSSIDVEALLADMSPESPCGEDLSYDPAYAELERALQGTAEQQIGDQVIPGEEPNWREVKDKALELLGRTKDLRVAVDLALALMMTSGLPGLRDGLALLAGLLEKHWEGVHPRLDPDDNNDPTERMNIVSALAPEGGFQDPYKFVGRLLEVPLCDSAQMGRFSMRHILVARGEMPHGGEGDPPNTAQVDAAFADTEPDALRENVTAVAEAEDLLEGIETGLAERVGAIHSPDLFKFRAAVKQVRGVLDEKAQRFLDGGAGTEAGDADAAAAPGEPAGRLSGEINSREDVVRALDKISDYYRRCEPSSPVPMLVRRARRMVNMDFVEVIRDMLPNAMPQVEVIGGSEVSPGETGG